MHSRRTDFHCLIVTFNSRDTGTRQLPLSLTPLFKITQRLKCIQVSVCQSGARALVIRGLAVTGIWTWTHLNSLSPKRNEHVGIWKGFDAVRYSSLLVSTIIFLRASQYVTHYDAHLLMFRSSATTWRSSGVSPHQLLTYIDSTRWTIHIQIIFYNTACFCHMVLHIRLLKRKVYQLYLSAECG
jgi:hypothetical protein